MLIEAIQTTSDLGVGTALYDAIHKAAEELSGRQKDRKAIIVITDGVDSDGTGNPISSHTIEDAIAAANTAGVPVFTVGLGAHTDTGILQQIAVQTGGTFYNSTTAANLATIYRQLADILFSEQYILTYPSVSEGDLTVKVSTQGLSGFDTAVIPACP